MNEPFSHPQSQDEKWTWGSDAGKEVEVEEEEGQVERLHIPGTITDPASGCHAEPVASSIYLWHRIVFSFYYY